MLDFTFLFNVRWYLRKAPDSFSLADLRINITALLLWGYDIRVSEPRFFRIKASELFNKGLLL